MDYHKQLENYKAKADELTNKARAHNDKLRKQIGNKIRKEVLIPFCKRNNLTLHCSVYSNDFVTDDGEEIDDFNVAERFPDDPASKYIEDIMRVEFNNDHIFDLDLGFDITKEDLE